MLYSQMPSLLVDILNTHLTLIFLVLIVYIAQGKGCTNCVRKWKVLPLLFIVIIVTFPDFAEVFMWHCGFASYMVPIIASLAYFALSRDYLITLYKGKPTSIHYGNLIAMVFCAIIAALGTFQLGGVIFLHACFLCALALRKKQFQWRLCIIPLLMLACIAILLISPGNANRLIIETGSSTGGMSTWSLVDRFWAHFQQHVATHIAPARLLLILTSTFCFVYSWRKGWMRQSNMMVGITCALAALAVMGSLYLSPLLPEPRVFSPAYSFFYVFAAVAFLSSERLFAKSRMLRYSSMVLLLVFMVIPTRQLGRLWDMHTWWQRTENMLESARGFNRDIIIPYCPTRHEPPFFFAYSYMSEVLARETWPFSDIAKAYGLKSVRESQVRCRYESIDGSIQAELEDVPDKKELLLRIRSQHPDIVVFFPEKVHMVQSIIGGDYGASSPEKELTMDKDKLQDIGYHPLELTTYHKAGQYVSEVLLPVKDSLRRPNCPRIYVKLHPRDSVCRLMIQHKYGE